MDRKKISKFKYRFEKTYLDELSFDPIIKDFIASLEPNYKEGYKLGNGEPESIDCRPRDGFISNRHNHGGYDKYFVTDLAIIQATGYELCDGYDSEAADKEYTEALRVYFKHDIDDKTKERLKDIPENKRDYNSLYEAGFGDIAESVDEYTSSWLGESSPILFGYRAMYEGQVGSWHTLMIYCIASYDEYRGFNGGDIIAEFEIKFRNDLELKLKLEKIKIKCESAL